jgi:hypothetical protein
LNDQQQSQESGNFPINLTRGITMLCLRTHDAVTAPELERGGGTWKPDTHWIVPLEEDIEREFVQSLLDKYASHLEAYSICKTLGAYCIELQFHDKELGEKCNTAYMKAFRKNGVVTNAKKALNTKPTKRIYKDRMYKLPDGKLFWYYATWDGHGNVVGRVEDENSDLLIKKVIHRSVVEDATLLRKGEEPWVPVRRNEA